MGSQGAAKGNTKQERRCWHESGDSLASLDGFSPSSSFSSWDQGCGIQEREEKEGSSSASLQMSLGALSE